MRQQTVREDDWVVIALDGEIDLARVDDLAQILTSKWNPTKNLLIDLSSVSFMDSTGLHWLFDTHLNVVEAHREMRLIVPEDGHIERLLSIVGAEQLFLIYHNLDRALAKISASEIFPIMEGLQQRQFGSFAG